MRKINEIIVHCSATRPNWMAGSKSAAKVAEIRRWHRGERGWTDIGYHFIIDRDGTVVKGRPVERVGAHVVGKNTFTIGVCLLGGYDASADDKFEENFTAEQGVALRRLIEDLRKQYPSIMLITGHNQYAAKACPGFRVGKFLGDRK